MRSGMRVWLGHAERYDEDPPPSRKHGRSPRRKWKTKARKTTPSPSWHTALPSFLIKTNRDSCKKAIAHQAIAFFVVLKIRFPPVSSSRAQPRDLSCTAAICTHAPSLKRRLGASLYRLSLTHVLPHCKKDPSTSALMTRKKDGSSHIVFHTAA